MKGIVYNLLEEVVSAEHGEDTWDALVDAAGVDGVYTSLGSYADEDLERLVAAASEHLGASPDEVVRWFGRRTMPLPGAATPVFVFDTSSQSTLVMEYRSARRLCAFAEGLLHGAADHYGERLAIERPQCVKRGDDRCVLAVTALP